MTPVEQTYPEVTAVIPTLQKITVSPSPTLSINKKASSTPLPPIVIEQPTREVTLQVDQDLLERKFPSASIQIVKPGPLSRLVSPITVQANVYPGENGLVSVQLIGEDGRVMAEQLLKRSQSESGWVQMITTFKFELPAAGESATIVVSTRDAYGRRIAQATVKVLLLQLGKNEIEPPGFGKQPFVVDVPFSGATIKGGKVQISGFAHSFNANPVIFELITQTGGVMTFKVITLPKIAQEQDYAAYEVEIPYEVNSRTSVRLTIRERLEYLPEIDVALSSQLVYLDP
ncbi:MAG: hypothetical protein NTZ74_16250 [Chloroflexi bacterium]|nr:hypothetical protein [Chloroflexota bacterium]